MTWNNRDTALTIQGVGALAGAWGQYKTDKQKNKLIAREIENDEKREALALANATKAQANLDDAFATSDFNVKKKKKNAAGVYVDDTTTA